ncbi:MAG: hypothetical protein ACOYEG_07345 [Petrimonas sp.]
MKYRLKPLFEPFIDFKDNNNIQISAKLRLYLWIMDGLEIKFDTSLQIQAPVAVNRFNRKLEIIFNETVIQEFNITYTYSSSEIISLQLHSIIQESLENYFKNSANLFDIELPSIKVKLPLTDDIEENKVPVNIMAIKTLNSSTMAVAVNLFNYMGGNTDGLSNFARNCNVGLAISKRAMTKTYDFFWEKTNWGKHFFKAGSFSIKAVNKVLEIGTEIISFVESTLTKALSLGFVEAEIEYISSNFEYTVDAFCKTKPAFDIQTGNRVRIFNLGLDLFIRLKLLVTVDHIIKIDTSGHIPDKCTPWDDDIVVEKKRKTVKIFDIAVPIKNLKINDCVGTITINETEKNLQCVIEKLDVELGNYIDSDCVFFKLAKYIQDKIVDSIEKKVVESLPPIVLSPTIFDFKIKKINWNLKVEGRKLDINNGEAIVGAYLYFEELQKTVWPVPKYIVNVNNEEIHRIGCDSILDTYENHQKGFYLLDKALSSRNNDGCKKCLPNFHKK